MYWCLLLFVFFKQKTAYEMRISDWSSDVCSSDLTKQIDTSIKIVRTQARRQPVVIATDPKNHVGMCMRSLRLNMRGKFPFRLVGDAIVEREVQAGML